MNLMGKNIIRTPYKFPCQNFVYNDAVVMSEDGGYYVRCQCILVHKFLDTLVPYLEKKMKKMIL